MRMLCELSIQAPQRLAISLLVATFHGKLSNKRTSIAKDEIHKKDEIISEFSFYRILQIYTIISIFAVSNVCACSKMRSMIKEECVRKNARESQLVILLAGWLVCDTAFITFGISSRFSF